MISFVRQTVSTYFSQHCHAALFVVWAIPLLLTTAFLVPPWTNSDEPFHMLRAIQVAHGEIIGHRFAGRAAGGRSDPAVYSAFKPLEPVAFYLSWRVTRDELRQSNAVKWHPHAMDAVFGNTVQYPPFFYIPDAAAYWTGRALHLHVNATLLLARLCNAAAFTALSALAIAMARRTRPLLLAILMLPMSIALGASASQDAMLIALTAVVVAYIDRIITAARGATARELCGLAIAIAMIGMARPPYAVLILLLLQAGQPRRATWIAMGSACLAVLLWCGLMAVFTVVPVGPSDPAAQWHNLVEHPAIVFDIARNTIWQSGVYASEFVGRLAWNDQRLPWPYLTLAAGVLALAAAATMQGPVKRPGYTVATIGAAIATIMVLQYFDWTPPGSLQVEGVVGRYFIPLAMAAGLALPPIAGAAAIRRTLSYAALLALALITPAIMLHHLALRFYVS